MDARYVREVECGDQTVEVLIKRSKRRSMAIHVYHDKPVELRAPLKCPWSEIESFLASRRQWIGESLNSLAAIEHPAPPAYVDNEIHHFLGRPLNLRCVTGQTRNVSINGDVIAVRCSQPDNPDKIRSVLEAFYRSEALRLMPARVENCLARFREYLPVTAVTVRKMKARWGSCSRTGEICLNTLLMQKPLAAIDFVVTHELCHLKHFAHNKAFYRLMDRTMPDWREREKLLGTDEVTLQLDLF
ncbi:MAG: SprT family zinc-dependent metalloprotease [Pseudomonadales bacterium]